MADKSSCRPMISSTLIACVMSSGYSLPSFPAYLQWARAFSACVSARARARAAGRAMQRERASGRDAAISAPEHGTGLRHGLGVVDVHERQLAEGGLGLERSPIGKVDPHILKLHSANLEGQADLLFAPTRHTRGNNSARVWYRVSSVQCGICLQSAFARGSLAYGSSSLFSALSQTFRAPRPRLQC